VPPGSNFNLQWWELQEPIGAVHSPQTDTPAQLVAGYTDQYFLTDPSTGAMEFVDPSNGVTTAHSLYARSELREMYNETTEASWPIVGNNTLYATLAVTQVPDHVCVGQIHIGNGTPASTKPLIELFYFGAGGSPPSSNTFRDAGAGTLVVGIEGSPSGGFSVYAPVAVVPLGQQFSYILSLDGTGASATISLTITSANGAAGNTTNTWPMPSGFADEGMYFKAGDYDQSPTTGPDVTATVEFYGLTLGHSENVAPITPAPATPTP